MMRALRLVRRADSGAAAAELALMLPVMLALIFTTFEGGNYLLNEHKVIKAVRDGARYASRLSYNEFDCASGTVSATATTAILNMTRTGTPDGTGFPRFTAGANDTFDVTLDCATSGDTASYENNGIYREKQEVPRVLVNAVVGYKSLFSTLGFDTSSAVVRAQAQSAVTGI